jgi:Transmembrane domain of unknown function (DUF3566)
MATTADDSITQHATPASAPPEASPIDLPVGEVAPSRSQRPQRPQRTPLRATRRSPAPRRTKVTVRKVGMISVFKFSLLFYLCAMLVIWLALLIIFMLLQAGGVLDTISQWVGCVVNGTPKGTKECLPAVIDGKVIFTWLLLAAGMFTIVLALLNTFVAIMYNLISDVVGGVEVTLSETQR